MKNWLFSTQRIENSESEAEKVIRSTFISSTRFCLDQNVERFDSSRGIPKSYLNTILASLRKVKLSHKLQHLIPALYDLKSLD